MKLAMILVVALGLFLAGCGRDKTASAGGSSSSSSSSDSSSVPKRPTGK